MNFDKSELRIYVYIRHKNGVKGKDIRKEMESAFPEESVPALRTIWTWISLINEDKFSFHKQAPPGRPKSASRIDLRDKMKNILAQDNRISTRYIADMLGCCKTTVHEIITEELGMKKLKNL